MSFRAQAITIIPAILLLIAAVNLALLTFMTDNPTIRRESALFALALFNGGLALAFCWGLFWVIKQSSITRTETTKNPTNPDT